jgi:cell wall-associated NlpC family hydrolase
MAKRGDLVLVRNADGNEIAGIVSLNGRHVVSPGETGLVHFSILDITRAWSIGDTHAWTKPHWHRNKEQEQ